MSDATGVHLGNKDGARERERTARSLVPPPFHPGFPRPHRAALGSRPPLPLGKPSRAGRSWPATLMEEVL